MPKIVKPIKTPRAEETLTDTLLGEYVRAKRTQSGLTIENAAAFCGVSKDTLMNIEHGNPKVTLGSVLTVCKGLGININIATWEQGSKDVWV